MLLSLQAANLAGKRSSAWVQRKADRISPEGPVAKRGSGVRVVKNILSRNGLEAPDGRPLHAYNVTDEEFKKLKQSLGLMMMADTVTRTVAQGFAIYASEHIRRNLAGGHPKWDPVFSAVGIEKWSQNFERELTNTGLKTWGRAVRVGENRQRLFIYTLMAEGGLPDAMIANAGHYQDMVLALVREVESEGTLGEQIALLAARRHQYALPQAFQAEETTRLLAELTLALVEIRSWIPEDLLETDVISWLEAQHPSWKQKLPLRLSDETIEALIRPVLKAEKIKPRVEDALVTRHLGRAADGRGWVGLARIKDGGFVQRSLIPGAEADHRLRILADSGVSFRALPENGGWRLSRNGGRGDAYLPAAPHQAIVASVYVDGVGLGEITLDPGLPRPEESLTLWRPTKSDALDPDELILLSGRGRTRAAAVWVLGPKDADASVNGALSLSDGEQGPAGTVWKATGNGQIGVGGQTLALATGQDSDAEPVRLVAFGQTLPSWTVGGAQVFLGQPQVLGAEGAVPLHQLGGALKQTSIRRSLAARIYEWVEDEAVLGRLRLVVLPADTQVHMREIQPGVLHLEASGLRPGWHVALAGGSYSVREPVPETGQVVLDLNVEGASIGVVSLTISDPKTGQDLMLSALWPSTGARIITPEERLLTRNTDLSVGWLEGWRAHLPDRGGAIQIRLTGQGQPVAFYASGTNRLNAYTSLIRQILSLGGPDAQINLRAVSVTETNRLQIRNYGWDSEYSHPFRLLEAAHSRLWAVDLDNPSDVRETTAGHRLDMEGWLPGDRVWYVQGRSPEIGDMRPFVWTLTPQPKSTRTSRIEAFKMKWEHALSDGGDPFWEQSWTLIENVRRGGTANGLDQVVALETIPAAAVALLFRRPADEVAAVLDLEDEAPFWWPSVPLDAWKTGVEHVANFVRQSLTEAQLSADQVQQFSRDQLLKQAEHILTLRPELSAHVGFALQSVGIDVSDQEARLSVVSQPLVALQKILMGAANNALQRFDRLPAGAAHVEARSIKIGQNLADDIQPLIDAPTVVAEVVTGREPPLQPHKMLQIFALRDADPNWFDTALPAIISLLHKMPK